MRLYAFAAIALIAAGCSSPETPQQSTEPEQTIEAPANVWVDESVAELTRKDGFLTLFADEQGGKVFAVFPAPDTEGVSLRAIYASGLTSGLGSNPVGLDRGLFDNGSLVAFRKLGNKLIAEQENWTYRASSDNALERRAVRESFARSFLWSGDISATGPNGQILVDISSFLTRDSLGIVSSLKNHPRGGSFSIASDRTFPDAANALAFPDNVEFDAFMTLTSDSPGSEVRATAADGRSITLVQHHSLVRLPEAGYEPRAFDPRSGAIDVPHYDFSSPLEEPILRSVARRYRLEKEDPTQAVSPAKEPIVFYVDAGAPPQISEALIEGASWWADAFEAAGFENAFRVEPLPEGVHPRDIRYNVISWTHRQTRGWSYGGGVHDPRTGEMLKGSVILGSQRVRQDRMIFEGLVGADNSGEGGPNDPVTIALNRIKQLSAHEVGHSLGFAHNFAASSNDRASVMDYPAPLVSVSSDGTLDLSQAYDDGIGEWDKLAATWLYAEFPEDADEEEELETILREGYASGLMFVGDREARSVATAHPYASVWDNGADAVAMLRQTMNVRRIALENFGARVIKDGSGMAEMRSVLVPIYLYHRYQIAAAAKSVGGFEFSYNEKGDALTPGAPVSDERQREALAALVETLDPAALALPDSLVNQLTPPLGAFGSNNIAETFASETGPVFDVLTAADSAAAITIGALLHPDRTARLADYQSRQPSRLGVNDVLTSIEQQIFASQPSARRQAIAQRLQTRFVSTLIALSGGAPSEGEAQAAAVGLSNGAGATAPSNVQAIIDMYLKGLRTRLSPGLLEGQTPDRAHREWLIANIERHFDRPAPARSGVVGAPDVPPGSPIGSPGFMETCWHCE
ncbi:zinc-dependent metalloprotease [Hyphococcus flavus]|uniref:Zinc-dependent metalloprotease n=1 Tax=Hyphococcus flavus TaxID=1866326 RepID=A0AAE9ZAZ9_9PROT|nr:zinc-dependent metalloprotease [Hyphococcus flavus]WDI31069.1 zinc-dependent metalloprotease [Hyphococcus flavus]